MVANSKAKGTRNELKARKILERETSEDKMKIKKICQVCGKEFSILPSYLKKSSGKFCSKECWVLWNRGENHPNYKGGEAKRICQVCGKEFWVKPSEMTLIKGRGKYCSIKCRAKGVSGKNNPKWKEPTKICEHCGKKYKAISQGRKKGAPKGAGLKFCSHECYIKSGLNKEHLKKALKKAQEVNKATPARGRYWYRKGRTREYRVMDILEPLGFYCCRAAGSKGLWDILAFNTKELKLIQVKCNRGPTGIEREQMELFQAPSFATKELWIFKDRIKDPIIKILK